MGLPEPYYQDEWTTLYHADCRQILPLLAGAGVDLLWTDAAYEIVSGGNTTGRMMGGIFDPEVYDNSGELFPTLQWHDWVPDAIRTLKPDAEACLMCNDKQLLDAQLELRRAGLQQHNVFVWLKGNKTPNRWGMKETEFILYWWQGRARALNDCGMPQVIRDIPNPTGDKANPTEKPVELPRRHIANMTDPGALVLDPFAGTGSTLWGARLAGCRAIGIEQDERQCAHAAAWLHSGSPIRPFVTGPIKQSKIAEAVQPSLWT